MFGYTGHQYDREIGIYYARARTYLPLLGRFMQVDPVGYKQSLNLYTYGLGNPVAHTDPSGAFIGAIGTVIGLLSGEMTVTAFATTILKMAFTEAITRGLDMIAPGAGAVFSAANTILSFGQSAFAGVGAGKVVDGAYIAANETGLNAWGRAEFEYSALSHEYTFTESMGIGFSSDQMADAAQRHAFPGQDTGAYATDGGSGWVIEPITGLPGGQIDTMVQNGGLTTINRTRPWHVLHDGVVIRSTWMSPTGNWYTTTFGFGLNARFTYPDFMTEYLDPLGVLGWLNDQSIAAAGAVNDWYGEILFRDLNTAMRGYLQ